VCVAYKGPCTLNTDPAPTYLPFTPTNPTTCLHACHACDSQLTANESVSACVCSRHLLDRDRDCIKKALETLYIEIETLYIEIETLNIEIETLELSLAHRGR